MLSSILGKKIGMTQVFTQDGMVVPVTVINVSNWFVTEVKSPLTHGYAALQLGFLKNKYNKVNGDILPSDWLKNKKKYFLHVREINLQEKDLNKYSCGRKLNFEDFDLHEKDIVKVTGKSKGLGFQGVVKRWGFAGGPSSHGSMFHREPGAVSNMRTQGNIIRGKRFPGHCGYEQVTIRGLTLVEFDKKDGHILVKGSVPGRKDSLVVISKQG